MTISAFSPTTIAPQQPTPLVPNSTAATGGTAGKVFGDILDAINPLQHIPVVSSIYRAATGSQISTTSQVAGDTLYGALLPGGAIAGLASSLASVAVKQVTGKDIGQMVVGATGSSSASITPTPLVADNSIATAAAQNIDTTKAPSVYLGPTTLMSNVQYQRAQALDAINAKLVKMAV